MVICCEIVFMLTDDDVTMSGSFCHRSGIVKGLLRSRFGIGTGSSPHHRFGIVLDLFCDYFPMQGQQAMYTQILNYIMLC